MKDKIKLEYQIDADNLIEKEDYGMFHLEEQYFYLTKIRRSKEEFQDLLLLYENMRQKNYPVHMIIPSVNGELIIEYKEAFYVLIKIEKPLEEYSLFDMIQFWNNFILTENVNSLVRLDWSILWSEKIDYFEYQIRELGKDKKIVLNSFSYFIGLAENAISYVGKVQRTIKPNQIRYVLCHRRVWYPNYHLNFDNPLQFVIDLEVRDVAEYLKSMMLDDEQLALIDLKAYLEVRHLDIYQLSMLYGRLLFPTYYFDLYENVMNKGLEEDYLLKIVDKSENIEEFLKKSYELIMVYAPIEGIDWLLKKEL